MHEGDGLLDIASSVACLQGDRIRGTWLTCELIQTTVGRIGPTTPFPDPERARTEIREGTRTLQVDTKGILMHIDRTHEIAVAAKPAATADPISSFGFVLASGTPAAGSSFGTGRARDASLLAFVREVVDVASVFPQRHATIVVPPAGPAADAVRIADEERADVMRDAEVDDFACGLMPQVTDAPLRPAAHLVLCALELLPAPRVFLAAVLLFGELARLLAPLPLEGTDAAPGDDQGFTGAGGHGGQVDFPQVDRRLHPAGSRFRLGDFDADVQLEAPVPHQHARSGVLRQGERQHHAPFFPVDGQGGPLDGIQRFGAPGILHAHLGMLPAQRARRLNVGEEGVDDLLHLLSIEGEPAFGGVLQLPLSRPPGMVHAGHFVGLHAEIPDLGGFLLRRFEAAEEGWRETSQAIDAHCFHTRLFFLSARKTGISRMDRWPSGVAFTPSPRRERALPLRFVVLTGKHLVGKGEEISPVWTSINSIISTVICVKWMPR